MPDSHLAESLIDTARWLISGNASEVTQASIRRSISTAYFAAFHALAKMSADSLVGEDKETRPNRAWVEVYRGITHGPCKDACAKSKSIGFPEEIEGFANSFVQLQDVRNRADYDPTCRPTLEEALQWVAIAQVSIEKLTAADEKSKVAFATWVLITSPGATKARNAVKENIGPRLGGPK